MTSLNQLEKFIEETKPEVMHVAASEVCQHRETEPVESHWSNIDPIRKCKDCGRIKFSSESKFRELEIEFDRFF
jgi:hypothetical protein